METEVIEKSNRYNRLSAIILIFVLVVYFYSIKFDADLHVYALNVGQGDALLIKTGDNKLMLVDTGPDEGVVGELQSVLPFWIRNLDIVLITHPDQDHIGGLPYILQAYDVDIVYMTPVKDGNLAYTTTLGLIEKKEIVWSELDNLSDFTIGCCTSIDVLWPEVKSLDVEDVNDISTAFILHYFGFSMYFGGDLGNSYEDHLVYDKEYDIDVVKVGHHGSRTSTSELFLDMTHPEFAIISVGSDNKFNHPSEIVLNRLIERDIGVLRTDIVGRIDILVFPDVYRFSE